MPPGSAGAAGIPLPETARNRWRRYVALGDSLSEGLGDPLPTGKTRGWASLLADRLRQDEPDLEFVNLAVRGYLARHALTRQLEPALQLAPELVTLFIGGNDVLLRPVFRPERFHDELDALVTPFVQADVTVVLSTLPDLTACSPTPHPVRAVLRRRITAANRVIESTARRHGTVLLDAWSDRRTRRHRMWSIDRIHPSAEGHRLIATSVAELLRLQVEPAEREPARGTVLDDARRHLAEIGWLVRYGVPT